MAFDLDSYQVPHNPNLAVLDSLPLYAHKITLQFSERQIARGRNIAGDIEDFTECDRCEGWIPAAASQADLDIAATFHTPGRKGRAYYCPRCGKELAFSGVEIKWR